MSVLGLAEKTFGKEETNALVEFLQNNDHYTMGKHIREFEEQFAKYLNVSHAVMVNSGSSANLIALALLATKIPKGSEILVPAVCWSTSVAPIVQHGFVPVFVDIDPTTMNVDIKDCIQKRTKNTRAMMAVHILGNCTNMKELFEFCKENTIWLMEDTCEALGTRYNGKCVGT